MRAPIQWNVTENGIVEESREGILEVSPSASPDWFETRVLSGDRILLPRESGHPDLSTYHFGRSDLKYPTRSTAVDLQITNLAGWQQGDTLQLVAPNVGLAISGLEAQFTYPNLGATEVRGQRFDSKNADSPIIEAGRGDSTWLLQMSYVPTTTGGGYNVVSRAGLASGFGQRDGETSTLAAELAPVEHDRTLTLRWRGSEFAALAAQAGPRARAAAAPMVTLRALPDVLAKNNNYYEHAYMYLPSLADLRHLRGSVDSEQTISYGNPFATNGQAWTEIVTMVYPVPVIVPGVGGVTAMMMSAMPVEALDGGALAPVLSPVRNVAIDGLSLDEPRTGAGTSPTITWDAPAIGTSDHYTVAVHAIQRAGDGVTMTKVATFHTKKTRLVMPDVLGDTRSYILVITAMSTPGRDLGARPLVGSLPFASADRVTALITR